MQTSEIRTQIGVQLWQLRKMCEQRTKRLDFSDLATLDYCEFEDYVFDSNVLKVKVSCTRIQDHEFVAKLKKTFRKLEQVLKFKNTVLKF